MALTQEAILNTLLEGRGKVKNSELIGKFRDQLNCCDPAEKKHNRDLFKTCVNNVAVVKELQDTKYIVLKKVYHHLLQATSIDENDEGGSHPEEDEKEQFSHSQTSEPKAADGTAALSPIETALERSRNVDFRPIRALHFTVPLRSDYSDDKHGAAKTNKPCALPLRMPQVDFSPRHKKPSMERLETADSVSGSPQLRRHCKTPKQPDESKYCPLDPAEHEWLVKSAAGQWNQVYGLLLKDAQLAEKKDFMSGFSALHWAVKCGNTDMVSRIIEVSRKSGYRVDIDGKSNGGYTVLHIAAIHDHHSLIKLLVHRYGANGNIRDNSGKKPYHYLRKGASGELRELLGEPKAVQQEPHQVRDENDPNKYLKNLIFPPHPVGLKKKNKTRIQFLSVGEDNRAERAEPVSHKQRLVSDVQ